MSEQPQSWNEKLAAEESADIQHIMETASADERTARLIREALRVLPYISPDAMMLPSCTRLVKILIQSIEAFGFKLVRYNWSRFPKRFHKNLPRWEVFPTSMADAEIEDQMQRTIDLNWEKSAGRREVRPEDTRVRQTVAEMRA